MKVFRVLELCEHNLEYEMRDKLSICRKWMDNLAPTKGTHKNRTLNWKQLGTRKLDGPGIRY